MYCSQLICISRTSLRPVVLGLTGSRPYTIPPGQSAPNPKTKQANKATLIYTTFGLAAAAGAYYYFRNTDEAQELKDRAKTDLDVIKQQAKSKLDQGKEKSDSAQSTAETRARGLVADLENSAKERAENIYNEAEQKVANAQKQGWLGWGKSKEEKKDV